MAKTKKNTKLGKTKTGVQIVPTIRNERLDAYFKKQADEVRELLKKYPIPEEILKQAQSND
jgi:hypothetical protein